MGVMSVISSREPSPRPAGAPLTLSQRHRELWPPTATISLLAGLTTWVTLLAWTGFAQFPAGFMVPLLTACLVVAVAGMLMRAVRVPAPVVALIQLLVLLLWLHHRLAGGEALGGLLPTPESVGVLLDAVRQSGVAAQTFSAPVPRTVPEFYPLLIVAGASTAVMVDFLAVGLRRAPLAGLPLLAAYTAPVSILDGGVSWLKFAAAALCFLFLLTAGEDQRLSHWGHHLTPRGGPFETRSSVVAGPAIWSSARRIGLTTTAFAVVAPLLVPTFTTTLFGGGSGGGGGGDSVNISNPMVDLKRDLSRGADVDLLRIETTDPDPSYLRVSVLNSFDGHAWRPAGRNIPVTQRADGNLPPAPGLQSTVRTEQDRASVRVNAFFKSRWLPTPYPLTSLDVPGDWRFDRSTMDFISAADSQTTAGVSYRLTSLRLSPTARQLANALPAPTSVFTPGTALPRSLPASVRRLAKVVVSGRTTKFEQAVALQQWFRVDGGFRYSLERSAGNGTDDLVAFLGTGENGRVGYCEQFAAAMAVLGRTLGIPSRVAVGFLHPDRVSDRTWVYSTHDLHAWPEMYFGGVGWVRFEPTPGERTGGVPAYTTQKVPQAPDASSSASPFAAPSGGRADKGGDAAVSAGSNGNGPTLTPGRLAGWVGLPLVVVLLLLGPRLARARVRRHGRLDVGSAADWVEAGWRELRDTAVDLRVPWDDRVTLRAAARALTGSFGAPGAPGATESLTRLVGLLERARYARSLPPDATTIEQVRDDVDTCVAALRAAAGRRARWRATWLPASVLAPSRTGRRTSGRRGGLLVGEPGVDRAV